MKNFNWQKKLQSFIQRSYEDATALGPADLDATPFIALRIALQCPRTLVIMADKLIDAEELHAKLHAMTHDFPEIGDVLLLPEIIRGRTFLPGSEAKRIETLHQVLRTPPKIVVASAIALLSPAPEPAKLKQEELTLRVGETVSFESLLSKLVEFDYDDEFEVTLPGEFARRGGIIDVYSPSERHAARIEFWGDQIESIRYFSGETQRSFDEIDAYRIIGRAVGVQDDRDAPRFDFLDYLHEPQLMIVSPESCAEVVKRFADDEMLEQLAKLPRRTDVIQLLSEPECTEASHVVSPECFPALSHLKSALPEEISSATMPLLRNLLADFLKRELLLGRDVVLLAPDEPAVQAIGNYCDEEHITGEHLHITQGTIPIGALFPTDNLLIIPERELFTAGMFRIRPDDDDDEPEEVRKARLDTTAKIDGAADLAEGDLAVHTVHGIGIFRGFTTLDSRGVKREVIQLEYRDGVIIYAPLIQAHLINRYIGRPGAVKLSKIGSSSWNSAKSDARQAVRAYAADLLRLQAFRNSSKGIVFPRDDASQRAFEREFPFEDTPDQTRSAIEIKEDMQKNRPMDRLLCGDVGYGKTELAMRAAFKALHAGYQVALMAPTTVLAQQHYYNFAERFAGYPFNIDMLSRFKTPAEQREIRDRLQTGGVDILIGTHAVCSGEVKFKNLGLVIIDEEQRFGVKHKERLRRLRAETDVLTMSATPIPRTLYMAMAGARDLSTLVTAPAKRLPVKTIIAQNEEKLIVEAIRQEFARGGQVYYLHNRVQSIEECALHLAELIPEARIGIGHGQLPEDELEQVMTNFLSRKIDLLVCSTIIESGLDVPNANTIIIERADRFGLAELYQLRGRVGRWKHQAYAYLLLPPSGLMSSDARKRIAAIRRYTHLGAGFQLALRDLEIRGAGNLLGAEQSGHLNSIGFDLYCQLLKQEVARMQGGEAEFLPQVEVGIDFVAFAHEVPEGMLGAAIAPEYIPDIRLRFECYRKLSGAVSIERLDQLRQEFLDRFGRLPECVEVLMEINRARILAARAGYTTLHVADGQVLMRNGNSIYRQNNRIPTINYANRPRLRLKHLLQILDLAQCVQSQPRIA